MMDDLAHRLASLRDRMNPPWDETRSKRVQLGVAKRQRRRRTFLAATAMTGASLVMFGIAYSSLLWQGDAGARAADEPLAREQSRSLERVREALPTSAPVRLADGSEATVGSPDGQLSIEINRAEQIQLRLESGTAHFEVVPNARRQFSVFAGSIEVSVIGTAFDVEQTVTRARVVVTHGKVRVRSAAGVTYLQAGEARWFDQERPVATEPAVVSTPAKRRAERRAAAPRKESAPIEWRSRHRDGDDQGASHALERGAAEDDSVEALIESADTARLTGDLALAERYLRRAVKDHPHDPTAAAAAFMLGRLLLVQLGRPQEAAEAFATVRELGAEGSLTQDALAREVEAWSKAGKIEQAELRAQLFIRLYPQSRRRHVVERYGGLATP
jgi:transmembrane sensor